MTDCTNSTHGAQLRECPFCGGEARIGETEFDSGVLFFECNDCGVYVEPKNCYADESKAIAAWNSRAERTCHAKPHLNLTIGDDFLKQSGLDCSECGGRLDLPVKAFYCPNCGAKVVGE